MITYQQLIGKQIMGLKFAKNHKSKSYLFNPGSDFFQNAKMENQINGTHSDHLY